MEVTKKLMSTFTIDEAVTFQQFKMIGMLDLATNMDEKRLRELTRPKLSSPAEPLPTLGRRDHPGDKRVLYTKVANNNHMEVTKKLMSTFTIDEPSTVTFQQFKRIGMLDLATHMDEKRVMELRRPFPKSDLRDFRRQDEMFRELTRPKLLPTVGLPPTPKFDLRDVRMRDTKCTDSAGRPAGGADGVSTRSSADKDNSSKDAQCTDSAPAGGADGVSTKSSVDNDNSSKDAQSTDSAGRPDEGAEGKELHFVDKHKKELIKRVTNVDSILDQLQEKEVIKTEVYTVILRATVSQQKMREIYLQALQSGNKAKDVFLEILEEEEPLLVEDLRQNK
ncbi:uncharacterized protein LOC133660476 isoform X2 [Entelurus aequoreus]|uniref:uncharacterized protein LOC133660476 isoform X2 n=1 Tax=Entelurus aequoreus TaxID=161455 RepID=UPI002B1DE978|nr:uncharacterized protein LOC133660476 isoform X2 [Entelurus aequoreus]